MKTLSDNTFFFPADAAGTVDEVVNGYRALGYDINVYLYNSGYYLKDCPSRGIVITEWSYFNYITVDCYTDSF